LSLEETVGYINRYLQQDYGDHLGIRYIDVDGPEVNEFPQVIKAVAERRPIPMVVVGETLKTPAVVSFAWVVNELRELGVLV
jgi:hypothetical protein